MSIGFDLDISWIEARLHAAGGGGRVQVDLACHDMVADPNTAIALGTVTLTNKGRAF